MLSVLKKITEKYFTMKPIPLIVVLGATATGKSQLAIDIALKFNGEIVSTDSMQVYKGLDIVTNKVTSEEMKGIKHHLIDFVDPFERITVVDFRARALKAIEEIKNNGKLPILVGGTNYYIESVLWNILINPEKESDSEGFLFSREMKQFEKETNSHPEDASLLTAENIFDHPIHAKSFSNIPGLHLHSILNQLDPQSAKLYHPHDKRKIIRALQVFQQSGRRFSEHLADQKSKGSSFGGPLRFRDAICFWTRSDATVLQSRIEKRVDEMIERGLLEELQDFHRKYNETRVKNLVNCDNKIYTEGIFQSIGFKEFHSYLTFPPDGDEEKKKKLLVKSIQDLKKATRQYARVQEKWIKNRFIHVGDRDVPDVFALDTSNPEKWQEQVADSAFKLIDHRLNGSLDTPPLLPETKSEVICFTKELFFCDLCQKHVHGNVSWSSHLKSKGHLAMSKLSRDKKQVAEKQAEDVLTSK